MPAPVIPTQNARLFRNSYLGASVKVFVVTTAMFGAYAVLCPGMQKRTWNFITGKSSGESKE